MSLASWVREGLCARSGHPTERAGSAIARSFTAGEKEQHWGVTTSPFITEYSNNKAKSGWHGGRLT